MCDEGDIGLSGLTGTSIEDGRYSSFIEKKESIQKSSVAVIMSIRWIPFGGALFINFGGVVTCYYSPFTVPCHSKYSIPFCNSMSSIL